MRGVPIHFTVASVPASNAPLSNVTYTWRVPQKCVGAWIWGSAGGGAGGGCNGTNTAGGGGGSGESCADVYIPAIPGDIWTIKIGTGGGQDGLMSLDGIDGNDTRITSELLNGTTLLLLLGGQGGKAGQAVNGGDGGALSSRSCHSATLGTFSATLTTASGLWFPYGGILDVNGYPCTPQGSGGSAGGNAATANGINPCYGFLDATGTLVRTSQILRTAPLAPNPLTAAGRGGIGGGNLFSRPSSGAAVNAPGESRFNCYAMTIGVAGTLADWWGGGGGGGAGRSAVPTNGGYGGDGRIVLQPEYEA